MGERFRKNSTLGQTKLKLKFAIYFFINKYSNPGNLFSGLGPAFACSLPALVKAYLAMVNAAGKLTFRCPGAMDMAPLGVSSEEGRHTLLT